MNQELPGNLQHLHDQVLAAIGPWNESDIRSRHHPDLSPAMWHAGHVAVIEAFWLRETILGDAIPQDWTMLYFPENTPKTQRSALLPDKTALLDFVTRLFRENVALLASLLDEPGRHTLLRDRYIGHFLVQHCAQHLETLAQISQQRLLKLDPPYTAQSALGPAEVALPDIRFGENHSSIGNAGDPWAYDNELPRHRVRLAPFCIASRPVSNAEYLGFMRAHGYDRPEYWPDAGWYWRHETGSYAPEHWRQDATGQWYAVTADGPCDLAPQAPVEGISRYEAAAFSRYCDCRLPYESEWELAAESGAIPGESIGTWEWCANSFYPYPGFSAFPYQRYSVPWFDGSHFTLRGASRHTHSSVRRNTFRNFYTADKRHIFAGLRLARDYCGGANGA